MERASILRKCTSVNATLDLEKVDRTYSKLDCI